MTIQEAIKARLSKLPIPSKEIECYGSQIVITSHSAVAARKWARVLAQFATVRGVVETSDLAKVNRGTASMPTRVRVWRTFATI